ncbi:cobalamin (vitamin B12) biosynthesis CbiM protein [human gut metagenome]|uniref:Cobalamin (Vitamin B12) biosynthesis CbiM protein n=1 Tax=human gut metagenome TaxID=408170 RepID=K1SWF8_9ZZZZ
MHMADALLSPAVAGTMYACSTAVAAYSVTKIRKEDDQTKIPTMGIMGAFVFAAQMINFTIPGTGSSGHLCGGMLLSAMLGAPAGFLTMIGILLIQCLMFADGGLMALGANVWNMAFYGCFIGAMVIWRLVMKNGASKKKIMAASIIGCVVTLQLGAFSVTLETLASGITELPFTAFVSVMQPIHLCIGLVEGIITGAVLCFVYEARPELLWGIEAVDKKKNAIQKVLAILLAMAVIVAGGLSLVASSLPDGLEWSISKITGATEVESTGGIYSFFAGIQDKLAILPDYGFKSSDTIAGTSFSGIVGGVVVILLCIVCCNLLSFLERKHNGKI